MDNGKSIELEEQYDDCQKMKERYEHIGKEFKSYEEYYSRLASLNPTVVTVLNSYSTMIDLFAQTEHTDDFYEIGTSIDSTDNESD